MRDKEYLIDEDYGKVTELARRLAEGQAVSTGIGNGVSKASGSIAGSALEIASCYARGLGKNKKLYDQGLNGRKIAENFIEEWAMPMVFSCVCLLRASSFLLHATIHQPIGNNISIGHKTIAFGSKTIPSLPDGQPLIINQSNGSLLPLRRWKSTFLVQLSYGNP